MILVDPTLKNDPDVQNLTGNRSEVTRRCVAIQFEACKPVAAGGTTNNAGRVYVVRHHGSRQNTGTIVKTLIAGELWRLEVDKRMNSLSPYRYWIDVDNVGDGVFVTLFIR